MIPRAFRILYPSAPVVPTSAVEQSAGSASSRCADPAPIAAGVAASSDAGSPTAAGLSPPAAVDHRVSAGTDELWLALVRRLG